MTANLTIKGDHDCGVRRDPVLRGCYAVKARYQRLEQDVEQGL